MLLGPFAGRGLPPATPPTEAASRLEPWNPLIPQELAEAGEEGKLLDAVAVASWPVAGFCAALRPAVLSRHVLTPDQDVRLTQQQPPYCLRIVCR